MEQTSIIPINKGKKCLKTKVKHNNVNNISELRKTRKKTTRKTNDNDLMVQLHHFANVTKSTTATKATKLNLTGESKALLENDYFKLINAKQLKNTEFVAKPFVINENIEVGPDFGNKIRCSASTNNNNITKHFCYTKNEFKDLVATKFKSKRLVRSPLADACRNINSMISIKDYHRVYCKQIFESRLFINGLLVYDHLKRHYAGVSVARNCFKKKFINKLDKATREIFPDIEALKTTTNNKENRLLKNVMEYYDNEETDLNFFKEQINRSVLEKSPDNNSDDIITLECNEVIDDRSITPVNEYSSPESFGTPPDQRVIPIDLTASSSIKYQTVFYEKDAKSGKTSLFELPDDFTVTGKQADKIDKGEFKRIDLSDEGASSSSEMKRAGVPNDLALLCDRGRPKRSVKKRLFHDYPDENANFAVNGGDDGVFVRPIYSPREFTAAFKRNQSPRCWRRPLLQTLKVDELERAGALTNIAKIKTPEHRYYPFVQFTRD